MSINLDEKKTLQNGTCVFPLTGGQQPVNLFCNRPGPYNNLLHQGTQVGN